MNDNEGFAELVEGLRQYETGDREGARATWSNAEAYGPLPALFARTLLVNLGGDYLHSNPYEAHPARTEHRQIDLFEQIRQLEFIHIAQQLVVNAHSTSPPGTTLLELGIGQGELTTEIVAASNGNIERVIGVDIDPSNVSASREALSVLDVEFVGVIGDFAELDWAYVRSHCTDTVSVNAAFSLYHLDLVSKTQVSHEVAALWPFRVTLVEPSSSHVSADMLERLISCYAYYSALWEAIRASPIRRDAQRSVLRFLGREISDVMRDDPVRYLRNEHWAFWYQMLVRTGLQPVAFPTSQLDPEVVQLLPGAANVHARNTHLVTSFCFASASATRDKEA